MKSMEHMPKTQLEKFEHGFQPVYYFSRCIGLWPFTITYDSNGSIKAARVRLLDRLWFLVSICLYLTALFFSYEDLMVSLNLGRSYYFADLLFLISQIPPLLFGSVAIVLNFFNRNRLLNILKNFIAFDTEVRLNFLNKPFSNLKWEFSKSFRRKLESLLQLLRLLPYINNDFDNFHSMLAK